MGRYAGKPAKYLRNGYAVTRLPRHPNAMQDGYVKTHVIVAEKALGRHLPPGTEVHHVDGIKTNNANSNLVICENHAYHMFIHARQRIQRAGGSPDIHKLCAACHRLLLRTQFTVNSKKGDGLGQYCKDCKLSSRLRDELRLGMVALICPRCNKSFTASAVNHLRKPRACCKECTSKNASKRWSAATAQRSEVTQ